MKNSLKKEITKEELIKVTGYTKDGVNNIKTYFITDGVLIDELETTNIKSEYIKLNNNIYIVNDLNKQKIIFDNYTYVLKVTTVLLDVLDYKKIEVIRSFDYVLKEEKISYLNKVKDIIKELSEILENKNRYQFDINKLQSYKYEEIGLNIYKLNKKGNI